MMIVVFDDKRSIFHLFLGFITPLWPHIGLIIALLYFMWQSWENEGMKSKKGDVIEFLTGAGGWAIVHTITSVL